nr:hypothetical protein [Tanacetum cinerariifolium]
NHHLLVLVQAVEATDDSPAIPKHTTVETPMNMSPENKAHFKAEKEAIHLILTGIGDEIYSTVDAFQTAQEIFYKLMNEMIRNNLTVATMQVNVQFLQQLQPEWSRFVTIVNQQHKLNEVSYHKLFNILKQYQKKVNELHAERLARNANPLALVATAQADQDPYYQTSRSHRSSTPSPKPSIPNRSHTTTKHKGKEIAKPITPPSEIASEEDNDPEQAQRDKDMQNNLALIAKYFKKIYKSTNNNLRTSSNSRNKNVDTTLRYKNGDHSVQFGNQRMVNVVRAREKVGSPVVQQTGIQCFNCKEFGHFAKECRKPKRIKDFAYHKEKMLMCNQAEQGVPLQAEHYIAKIQEVPTAETGIDSEPVNRNLESYKEYYAIASGAEPPKTKESVRKKQSSSDTTIPPPTTTGKTLKTSAKVGKPAKEKKPAKSFKAKGLTVLYEVPLTKAEQMKLSIKRSLTQTHISHASGSGENKRTGIIPGVPDVPTYKFDDEEISWKSSENDDDDEVKISEHADDVDDQSDDDDDDKQTDSDNDGDDFVHPKFSTHDEEDKDKKVLII